MPATHGIDVACEGENVITATGRRDDRESIACRGAGCTRQVGVGCGRAGVVFRDIGTSPICTIQTVFDPGDPHPVPVSTENVYGIVSLIFW